MTTLPQHMKLLRKALCLTQRELAGRLGVTTKTVERYETARPPKGKRLLQLAEIATKAKRPDLAMPFIDEHDKEFKELRKQLEDPK